MGPEFRLATRTPLEQAKWEMLDRVYPTLPPGAGLVGSTSVPLRENAALGGGLSLSKKQQRLRPKPGVL